MTGLTPAVVTEAMYALAVQADPPFVPTEVQVVTTAPGRELLLSQLLARPAGQFHALLRDYAICRSICFTHEQVHVIKRDGRPLIDIDTHDDSAAAGDTLLAVVRMLAADPDCAIHASIAGGRKSMSFLLGMAMTLLGRAQDRLSHVLVRKALEAPGFFYPAVANPHPLQPLSTALDAPITLASIPLLRVFDGLGRSVGEGGRSFEEMVQLCQLEMEAPRIEVKPAVRTVSIGKLACALSPREMFIYTLLALRRIDSTTELGVAARKAGAVVVRDSFHRGFDGPLFEAARQRLPNHDSGTVPTPAQMRQMVSRINRKLGRAFGSLVAKRAEVVGPGWTDADGHFGLLNTEPDSLRVL